MASNGLVGEIERCTTVDGPGIRTIVFLKGCPLHCVWCHNPEHLEETVLIGWDGKTCIGCNRCLQSCPYEAIRLTSEGLVTDLSICQRCGTCVRLCPAMSRIQFGRYMTVDEVYEEINRDKVFYDTSNGGITISGGEPFVQASFTKELLKKCKESNIHTALDTCGYADEQVFIDTIKFVDLVLYDLKQLNPYVHKELTGVPIKPILKNLMNLERRNVQTWIRTPIVPGMTDDEENIKAIASMIAPLRCVTRWELLPFHRFGVEKYAQLRKSYHLKSLEPPSSEYLDQLQKIARQMCPQEVYVR